jgi:hypothetical protein
MYPHKDRNRMYHNLVDPTADMIAALMELQQIVKSLNQEDGGDISEIQNSINTLETNLSTLQEAVGNKADVTALAGKANQSDLDTLASTVSEKANATDLAGKADQSDLESLAGTVTEVQNNEILSRLTIVDGKLQLDGQNVVPEQTDGGTA